MTNASAVPPRPYRTPEIKADAVNLILKEVMVWAGSDEAEADGVRDLLVRCADDDAYRFARNLEDRFWDVDAQLVEILGGYDIYGATREAVKAWVAGHRIAVPFAIGDMISYRTPQGETTFRIVEIQAETAEVVAQPVPPLADDLNWGETGGWLIAAEKARLVSDLAEASAPS